jgi:peptidoglycan hydrolase CwlO-like protein
MSDCICSRQKEIEQLKIDVAVAKSDITSVKGDITEIKTQIAAGFKKVEEGQSKMIWWLIPTLAAAVVSLGMFLLNQLI